MSNNYLGPLGPAGIGPIWMAAEQGGPFVRTKITTRRSRRAAKKIGRRTGVAPASGRKHSVAGTIVHAVKQLASATRSPLASFYASAPDALLALFATESSLNTAAVATEGPSPGSRQPRYSYGVGQILDQYARDLWNNKALLGRLASQVPKPPPVRTAGDAGYQAWAAPLLNWPSAVWYPMIKLRQYENFFNAHFAIAEDGALVAKPGLRADLKGRADAIAEYLNGVAPAWNGGLITSLLRLYWLASSLGGINSLIQQRVDGSTKADSEIARLDANYTGPDQELPDPVPSAGAAEKPSADGSDQGTPLAEEDEAEDA